MSEGNACEQALRQLGPYLDRELSDDEMTYVRRHIDDCPPCAVCFEFEGTVVRYVRERAPREKCVEVIANRIITGFRARVAARRAQSPQ